MEERGEGAHAYARYSPPTSSHLALQQLNRSSGSTFADQLLGIEWRDGARSSRTGRLPSARLGASGATSGHDAAATSLCLAGGDTLPRGVALPPRGVALPARGVALPSAGVFERSGVGGGGTSLGAAMNSGSEPAPDGRNTASGCAR